MNNGHKKNSRKRYCIVTKVHRNDIDYCCDKECITAEEMRYCVDIDKQEMGDPKDCIVIEERNNFSNYPVFRNWTTQFYLMSSSNN